MGKKRTGTLFYDQEIGAYNIRLGQDSFYGGVHKGKYFYVKVKNAWIPVRMEKDNVWHLAGMPEMELDGLMVRI